MKSKKILSAAVALFLIVSVFVSCASNGTASNLSENNNQTQEGCVHEWNPATCQEPKTCVICSVTEGSALSDHDYVNGKCRYCQVADPKEIEIKAAKTAYNYLTQAHELCIDVSDSIYGAWYFAIYKSDDYIYIEPCLKAFCSEANIGYNEALTALNEVLKSLGFSTTESYQVAALQTFSVAVIVAQRVHEKNGVYNKIENNLSKAKTALKEVTNTYSDYTGYSTLKSYFSEVSACAEYCESPTGSFQQFKSTIEKYETNLRNYKSSLSFIFE